MFGSETAEMNLRTVLFPYESADVAVPMLFAAVGGRCWGARRRR